MKRKLLNIFSLIFTLLVFFSLGNSVSVEAVETNSIVNSLYNRTYEIINIPSAYYQSVDLSKTESEIRTTLHNIISTGYVHKSYADIWTIDRYADADPRVEGAVTCLYTGQAIVTQDGSGAGTVWNREHVWCKSHGFPDTYIEQNKNNPYSDAHHLRPSEKNINSTRNNSDFFEFGYTDTTTTNTGYDSYGNKWTGDYFEPRDEVKGDIARMLLYMEIRYGVDDTNYSLDLVNNKTSASNGNGRLGFLNTLLKWHYEDPVSIKEIYRNNVIYGYQKNRNPFIDHPEYVDKCFTNTIGSYNAETMAPEVTDYNPSSQDSTDRVISLNQTIGFESTEGFTAKSNYNNTTENVLGSNPSFGVLYGCVSTNAKISGSQSAQLRFYKEQTIVPSLYLKEDIKRLAYIKFKAKYADVSVDIKVSYSTDGGANYVGSQTYDLTTTATEYTYNISTNAGYENVRFKIDVILPDTISATGKIVIDDIMLYTGVESYGSEYKSTVNTKASMKFAYQTSQSSNTINEYKLVEDTSSLAVGDIITLVSKDYDFAATSFNSTKNVFNQVPVTKYTNNTIAYSDSILKLELCEGSETGSFALKVVGENKYINTNNSGNKVNFTTTISASSSFKFTTSSVTNKASIIGCDSTNNKYNVLKYLYKYSWFSIYQDNTADPELEVYKLISKNDTDYNFSSMQMRFGTIISKQLYTGLLSEGENVTFGVELSLDGVNYQSYTCDVANVADSTGMSTSVDNNGAYYQWAVVFDVPKDMYQTVVFARAFVCIDGNKYYASMSSYSISLLANYYVENVSSEAVTINLKALEYLASNDVEEE